ncbi:hypothetical protein G3I40_15330 [Streptomyces sp. SID14478]|uniref:hypothetical protein n=1 Tax=Streptomyces sp. SID14478 TaxID=2706073 RepID=UPI0013DA72A0|nr:hypothetical protein [Streptomyces sp. SID14478]NEB76585.1 hypothetical protein [Streptomyces sp. SID14478]
MTATATSVIASMADAAWAKFDGYNMRLGTNGRGTHAVSAGHWKGLRVPRPACGTREWGPVTCHRPGCRELRGSTGSEAAYQREYAWLTMRIMYPTGQIQPRVPLAECVADAVRTGAGAARGGSIAAGGVGIVSMIGGISLFLLGILLCMTIIGIPVIATATAMIGAGAAMRSTHTSLRRVSVWADQTGRLVVKDVA